MEQVEALVVGAGPSGLACAAELAREGVQVFVIDQAPAPGVKNARAVLHGRTSGPSLDDVFPSFLEEAPVERRVGSMRMHCLGEDRRASFRLDGLQAAEHAWSVVVDRSRFDAWLAGRVDERAQDVGGGVAFGVRAEDVVEEGGEVVGVRTTEVGEVRAEVIVAADGSASAVARGAGLRSWGDPEGWFVQAHADVHVPGGNGSEGAVLDLFTGGPLASVRGSGFVAPREGGVRVGVWARLDAVLEQERGAEAVLEELVEHPGVASWLPEGSREVGFGASLVPDARRVGVASPARGRVLAVGEAAGHGQVLGPLVDPRGTSGGILAARAIVAAREGGAVERAGDRFSGLIEEHLGGVVDPARSGVASALAGVASSVPWGVSASRVRSWVNDPSWARAVPDSVFVTAELPLRVAREAGERVEEEPRRDVVRSLEERVGALSWETDVEEAHVRLRERGVEEAGGAVHACPMSRAGSSWGCFRVEEPSSEDAFVAVDYQACVECGACGVLEGVAFEPPRGGFGVAGKGAGDVSEGSG